MQPHEDDQHVALAILELEVCSGQRWEDIPDAKLHDAIASLTARPSEEQLSHAVRYIKRWRDHAVHGQPLPPNLLLLNGDQNNALSTDRKSNIARAAPAAKAGEPTRAPPGTHFAQILRAFMTARAFRRYVYPAITEMQAEYYEALAVAGRRQARWVVCRGHFFVVPTFLYGLAAQSIRRLLAR